MKFSFLPFVYMIAVQCCPFPILSSNYLDQPLNFCPLNSSKLDSIIQYFHSIDETTPLEESVHSLVVLRNRLVAEGYSMPPLTSLSNGLKEYFVHQGVSLDEENFRCVQETLREAENAYHLVKDKKKKTSFTNKKTLGILKCLAGGLLCITPIPVVQTAGSALIMNGIYEYLNADKEKK